MSSEWELYMTAKFLTIFKHLRGVCSFRLIWEEKTPDKIIKEGRAAVASVKGFANQSSNLGIMFCFISKLIYKYKYPFSSTTIFADQCTDRWCWRIILSFSNILETNFYCFLGTKISYFVKKYCSTGSYVCVFILARKP